MVATMDAKIRINGLKWAKERFETTFAQSAITDKSSQFPHFDFREVEMGKVLGKGTSIEDKMNTRHETTSSID